MLDRAPFVGVLKQAFRETPFGQESALGLLDVIPVYRACEAVIAQTSKV